MFLHLARVTFGFVWVGLGWLDVGPSGLFVTGTDLPVAAIKLFFASSSSSNFSRSDILMARSSWLVLTGDGDSEDVEFLLSLLARFLALALEPFLDFLFEFPLGGIFRSGFDGG